MIAAWVRSNRWTLEARKVKGGRFSVLLFIFLAHQIGDGRRFISFIPPFDPSDPR